MNALHVVDSILGLPITKGSELAEALRATGSPRAFTGQDFHKKASILMQTALSFQQQDTLVVMVDLHGAAWSIPNRFVQRHTLDSRMDSDARIQCLSGSAPGRIIRSKAQELTSAWNWVQRQTTQAAGYLCLLDAEPFMRAGTQRFWPTLDALRDKGWLIDMVLPTVPADYRGFFKSQLVSEPLQRSLDPATNQTSVYYTNNQGAWPVQLEVQ